MSQGRKKIAVIGLGLIGGSLVKALHDNYEIIGITSAIQDEHNLDKAYFTKIFSFEAGFDLGELQTCEFIIIATPMSSYEALISLMRNCKKSIILELGSLQRYPESLKSKYNIDLNLCHPIAGSEKSGWKGSSENLFENKLLILDPQNTNNSQISRLFQEIGMKITLMNAEFHDKIYAFVSHFPQVLSFAFNKIVTNYNLLNQDLELQNSVMQYRAFRRISSSSHANWIGKFGIFSLNKDNLLTVTSNYMSALKMSPTVNLPELAFDLSTALKNVTISMEEFFGSGVKDMLKISNFHPKTSHQGLIKFSSHGISKILQSEISKYVA